MPERLWTWKTKSAGKRLKDRSPSETLHPAARPAVHWRQRQFLLKGSDKWGGMAPSGGRPQTWQIRKHPHNRHILTQPADG